jgi:hypothetical protein
MPLASTTLNVRLGFCISQAGPSFEIIEATIPKLQAALATGLVTSRDLVAMYLARIEAYDQKARP